VALTKENPMDPHELHAQAHTQLTTIAALCGAVMDEGVPIEDGPLEGKPRHMAVLSPNAVLIIQTTEADHGTDRHRGRARRRTPGRAGLSAARGAVRHAPK